MASETKAALKRRLAQAHNAKYLDDKANPKSHSELIREAVVGVVKSIN